MQTITFDLNQFLKAVSFALDFVEIDILGASANHSRRVAYISNRIAETMKLPTSEQADITAFAIMHDNGLAEEVVNSQLKFDKLPQLKRMEGFRVHCEFGENNIRDYPFMTNLTGIVKYHHENYDGSGFFGLRGDDIPLLAQIIGLADFTDNYLHFERGNKLTIDDFIKKNIGKRFSPQVAEAYLEVSNTVKFWLDLQNEHIHLALDRHSIKNSIETNWEKIFSITKVFSSIVDSKSKFTFRHTKGIIEKAEVAADFYGKGEEEKIKLMIAASLHDLGKLAISTSILEKNGPLDQKEFNSMKTHTYYTKYALSQISNFEDIREWAANHHEKLNGKGYPESLTADALDFNSRLIACIDIYQALAEDRPYRKGMSFDNILQIMEKMADDYSIDKDIVTELIPFFIKNELR
ncbi:MAG: HD domain-containing protein [Candidatus Cloacimonetes bacterium]|nr:HD domain-containing protein [Candidatus Cloacimonadota bacterium]